MIKTTSTLLDELKNYASASDKLSRLVKQGVYIPVVKGLYETDKNTPGYLLAGSIYGPSYLSFEFALAWHGLIPEHVYAFTCASFEKKKKKKYDTPFGVFTYRDVPPSVFYMDVEIKTEAGYSFMLATPEKALCDKLYTLDPAANQTELRRLLFDDLRIDEELFYKLDRQSIYMLSEKYHSTNVKKLSRILRKGRA